MSDIVIRVENLSKRYQIGERQRSVGLRHVLNGVVTAPLEILKRRAASGSNGDSTHIWALKDISFNVRQGEVVGFIGRNGAGKTTLLKLLARVAFPTSGFAEVRGRMGSLLEVGTGFHPELTGRENTYLSGAILGMKRAEIVRKFDEIVAFSEIEKFIDTPLKHYSSGMKMRLAFSVAAHLEPEILLVDEVLAVGDAAFQKKCLGKMGQVAREGRTILFVSHNMAAIQALCPRGILLVGGLVVLDADISKIIPEYLSCTEADTVDLSMRTDRQGDQQVRVAGLSFYPATGQPGDGVRAGDDAVLEIAYESPDGHTISQLGVTIGIFDSFARAITFLENLPMHHELTVTRPNGAIRCRIPRLQLLPGRYYLNIQLRERGHMHDWVQQAHAFNVHEGDFFGTGKLTYSGLGGVYMDHEWEQD